MRTYCGERYHKCTYVNNRTVSLAKFLSLRNFTKTCCFVCVALILLAEDELTQHLCQYVTCLSLRTRQELHIKAAEHSDVAPTLNTYRPGLISLVSGVFKWKESSFSQTHKHVWATMVTFFDD